MPAMGYLGGFGKLVRYPLIDRREIIGVFNAS